jgi:hypothetical protein
MTSSRTSDLAILLGHALKCEDCRQSLLAEPERFIIGRKLSDHQRELLLQLTPEDFENSTTLARAVDMDVDELLEATNHPRARLRHL